MEMKSKLATINNKINNYSDLLIPEKEENNSTDNLDIINNRNGDIVDNMGENVVTTNTFDSAGSIDGISKGKNDRVNWLALPFILLLLIGLILLSKWIYENYIQWKSKK
jgi:hypothetical protein